MPVFHLHLRRRKVVEPNDLGIEFRDVHHAYLEVCKTIPVTAQELLIEGQDPMGCAYIICDKHGRRLMEVPFEDVLSPTEWRIRRARCGPYSGVRSDRVRDDLALSSFRRMFANVHVGCVLLTPELQVKEMNAFGARHSHVDPEAIRDTSILNVFDLNGTPKANFAKFWSLSQRGAASELIDMPYLVLDDMGATANGWWNARTWPIFDDDDHLLGLVEWAEPYTKPTIGGSTLVRIAPSSTA